MIKGLSQTSKEIVFAFTDTYFAGARALFDTFYVFFVSQLLGMPLSDAGMIYGVGLIMRAMAEPLSGMISDHIVTPWGKRKPFFVIGGPLVFLTFVALWYPYQLEASALFTIGLMAALSYGLVSGAMMTPYAAMGPDLVQDYHGRTRLSNLRHLFQLIILTITIVTFSHYFSGEKTALTPSYLGVVIGFGLLFSLPFLMLSLFIPEKQQGTEREHWTVLFKRLALPFRVRSFDIFLVMNGCIDTVLILLPALFPFYLKFYLHSFEYLPLYAVSLGTGAFLAIFVLMKFGKTWCKIKIFRSAVALAIGIMLGLAWLPPGDEILANGLFFLLGFVVAGTSSTRLSMLTDLAEVVSDRFQTSCQATVFAMAKAVAQSFAGGLMLVIFKLTDLRDQGSAIPVDGTFVKKLLLIPSLTLLVISLAASLLYTVNQKVVDNQG
jgi:oligogalacturonide transporter